MARAFSRGYSYHPMTMFSAPPSPLQADWHIAGMWLLSSLPCLLSSVWDYFLQRGYARWAGLGGRRMV
ncbi:hypothetical protein JR316_0013299 [Psilocybe cubensis]|uniref:Uncharacterized protein n=1 Tax=Psilocybe cubensis TaxID=181762 RepID=A0ACB8GGV6_PSICU|nr:hypothetical protein JR316_0013299 [Psilocybe cubensis]KAH9474833.1 hypothetical protein JR316_0013299 [Psilocybe cubensis]